MKTPDEIRADNLADMERGRADLVALIRARMAKTPGYDRARAEAFLAQVKANCLPRFDAIDPIDAERIGQEIAAVFPAVLDELFPEGGRPPLG